MKINPCTTRLTMRFVAFFLVLTPVVVLGCARPTPKTRRGQFVERLPQVEVVQPTKKRLMRRLETTAMIEAMRKVDVSARIPGEVRDLDDRMDIGRSVKKDEVLLRLYVPELEADRSHKQVLVKQSEKQEALAGAVLAVAKREVEEGQAEAKRFAADVAYNRLRFARIRDLVRQRAQDQQTEQEAQKQLEASEASLSANRASIAKREAKVEAARAEQDLTQQKTRAAEAEVKRLDEMIGLGTVKAPFAGVITRRWVDPGAIIKDPGTPLLTLMQIDRVRALIDVPQRDAQYLNAREQNPNPDGRGDTVYVRMPTLRESVKEGTIQGTITRVSRMLDPVTRTMRAEIELDNKDLRLQPGMYGSASVLIEDRPSVLTLPASALVRRNEGLVEVYKVAGVSNEGEERRGVLERVPVVLGIDDGKEVEIREGLRGDEWIVQRATGIMRADETVLAISERDTLGDR